MYAALIIVFMVVVSGCKSEVRDVKEEKVVDIKVIKAKAIAKCTSWKEEEYNWKPEEIKEYCTEMWRGYRD